MSLFSRVADRFVRPLAPTIRAFNQGLNGSSHVSVKDQVSLSLPNMHRRTFLQGLFTVLASIPFIGKLFGCGGPEINRPVGEKEIDIFGVSAKLNVKDLYGNGTDGNGEIVSRAYLTKTSIIGGEGNPFLNVKIVKLPKIKAKQYHQGAIPIEYSSNGHKILLRINANVLQAGNEQFVPVAEKIWFKGSDKISQGIQEVFLVIEKGTRKTYRALRGNDGIYQAIDDNNNLIPNILWSSKNNMETLIPYPLMYAFDGKNVSGTPKSFEWLRANLSSLEYVVKEGDTKIGLEEISLTKYSGTITGSEIDEVPVKSKDGESIAVTQEGVLIPLASGLIISRDTQARIEIELSVDVTKSDTNLTNLSTVTFSDLIVKVELVYA